MYNLATITFDFTSVSGGMSDLQVAALAALGLVLAAALGYGGVKWGAVALWGFFKRMGK